jgi:hypothetical protein
MPPPINKFRALTLTKLARFIACLVMLSSVRHCAAQDVPLLSGGVGFFTSTNSGQTSYLPLFEPLIAAPIGPHLLIESRAILLESISPKGGNQTGYDHSHFISLTYLQGAYTLTSHVTVVGGTFLIPFNTYNDRLTPIWIGKFQSGPLTASIGSLSFGAGTGGMLSGSAISRPKYSISYNAFLSSREGNSYFASKRSFGGRSTLYLPQQRLEMGLSYNRLLQGVHENFYGAHLWWEPKDTGLQVRSEYSRGHHAHGYWVEAAYRTPAFGGFDSFVGRFEPVFRMNQTFRRDTVVSDGVPLVNTKRADFGLDYNLPHNARILTSFSRQFASTGNSDTWQTGIVYRFLFPAWKGN